MQTDELYKYAVVGKGMIGSAAARYLSRWSDGVVLIGPDEPSGAWANHPGAFAAHYDQGRITRRLDPTLEWAMWADRSLGRYAEIEAESGIRFHTPSGSMLVCEPSSNPESYLCRIQQTAWQLGTQYETYSSEAYRKRRPEIALEDGLLVLEERQGAGTINPRQLVKAHVTLAEKHGAAVIREEVTAMDPNGRGVSLTTHTGQTIRAEKVLVAAGAWSQFLVGIDLGLTPTPRTLVLARLDRDEANRLKEMPTVIFYEGCEHPDASGFYILPPIIYPDGHAYLKIGADLPNIKIPKTAKELNGWFHGDGNRVEAASCEDILRRVIPRLRTEGLMRKTCVTMDRTPNLPLIKEVIKEKVLIAVTGAAKSSDELGRLAAVQCLG